MKITLGNPAYHHLTEHERKAIRAILEAGLTAGKVGRKSYFLDLSPDGKGTVTIDENGRGLGFVGECLRHMSRTCAITVDR